MIDDAQLRAAVHAVAPHLPDNIAQTWTEALSAPMRSCGMLAPNRAAAALGQFSEESGGFAVLQENLRYSAQRLCEVCQTGSPNSKRRPPTPTTPRHWRT